MTHTAIGRAKIRAVADADRSREYCLVFLGTLYQCLAFPPVVKSVYDKGLNFGSRLTQATAVKLAGEMEAETIEYQDELVQHFAAETWTAPSTSLAPIVGMHLTWLFQLLNGPIRTSDQRTSLQLVAGRASAVMGRVSYQLAAPHHFSRAQTPPVGQLAFAPRHANAHASDFRDRMGARLTPSTCRPIPTELSKTITPRVWIYSIDISGPRELGRRGHFGDGVPLENADLLEIMGLTLLPAIRWSQSANRVPTCAYVPVAG